MGLGTLLKCFDDEVKNAKQTLAEALLSQVKKESEPETNSLTHSMASLLSLLQVKHKLVLFLLEEMSGCLTHHLSSSEQEQIWEYLEDRLAIYNLCIKRDLCLSKDVSQRLGELLDSSYPN